MTNIAELVEYVFLPLSDDIARPRALNTFLDGLAELEVNKRLIKNKRLLSDLLKKEKVYRNKKPAMRMMKETRPTVMQRKALLRIVRSM